jgi:hypothetical protein
MAELATVKDYAGLTDALRARATELEMLGVAPIPIRRVDAGTLGPMLQCLAISLLVVEDADALARITSRLKRRENTSASMLARPRPARRAKLGSEWAARMNARRNLVLSHAKRKAIALHAIRSRWSKSRVSVKGGQRRAPAKPNGRSKP